MIFKVEELLKEYTRSKWHTNLKWNTFGLRNVDRIVVKSANVRALSALSKQYVDNNGFASWHFYAPKLIIRNYPKWGTTSGPLAILWHIQQLNIYSLPSAPPKSTLLLWGLLERGKYILVSIECFTGMGIGKPNCFLIGIAKAMYKSKKNT